VEDDTARLIFHVVENALQQDLVLGVARRVEFKSVYDKDE